MKALLRAGEFKRYTEHLASMAGIFLAMAEEIAVTLLTEQEINELECTGRRDDGDED